ncbi:MAG: GreA/GreB family elongation factor [Lachnospiraceae bacterium]|nr:GreA/GreB family elongation factor [Lachnospiraceae bacterium]
MYDKLTPSDIKKMEEEIEYRKVILRKNLLEEVKEARSHGDLSENFEYYAAKKEKNKNESRIRFLERMIKTAQVIEDSSGEDEVGMNDKIELFIEEDGVTEIYRIVTTVRANSLKRLVSIESPMGKALMGKKTGDRVEIKVNESYSYYAVIKNIEKVEDDSQDVIRGY